VAAAQGVRVSDDAIAKALSRLDALPPDARTSMQRDLEAGRQSELEEQVGVIVRMAESAGIDAPIHRVLYAARAAQAAQAGQAGAALP
jgi:2-dehydropantoate 2-reductase